MKSSIAKFVLSLILVASFAGCAGIASTGMADAQNFEKQRSQTDGSYRYR